METKTTTIHTTKMPKTCRHSGDMLGHNETCSLRAACLN
jgi:hypothetical protein